MPKKNILFLSSNNLWGGSEVLWTQAAKRLSEKGYGVQAGVLYDYALVKNCIPKRESYIDLDNRLQKISRFKRLLKLARIGKFPVKDYLLEYFKQFKPALVVISQGNNMDGRNFMKECVQFNLPYVTITQLTAEVLWPGMNDTMINELRTLYKQAKRNYFVSSHTLALHEKMMGEQLSNAGVVYNPFTKTLPDNFSFPSIENGVYKIALVGRIETFHKGYDLLIDVLRQEKWKLRPVHFSIFGKGPHTELLTRLLQQNNISNVSFNGHIEEVQEIWRTHHLLLMPSRIEGQALALIEAMHFNRAAVVTAVGGTTELIEEGKNGFIALIPTPEQIDGALERAWQRRSEWEELGKNAAASIALKHPSDAIDNFNQKIELVLQEIGVS